MKISYYLVSIAVFFLITVGCKDNDGQNHVKVTGTGPIVTKRLDLSSFDKIELNGVANFYITIGSPQSVVLKAQQNIIDIMTYEVYQFNDKRVGPINKCKLITGSPSTNKPSLKLTTMRKTGKGVGCNAVLTPQIAGHYLKYS